MSLISLPTSRLVEMRIAVHGRAMDAPSVIGLSQHEFVEMACSVYSRIIADRGRRCGVYSGAFAFAVRTSVVVGPLAAERAEARPDAKAKRRRGAPRLVAHSDRRAPPHPQAHIVKSSVRKVPLPGPLDALRRLIVDRLIPHPLVLGAGAGVAMCAIAGEEGLELGESGLVVRL